jgi:uncharacterized protein
MDKLTAVAKLRDSEDAIRALGATSLYLFGSTARDEARPDSDLDVFIEYDPSRRFSLIDLAGIKLEIEDRIGTEVHVTTRDSLHPKMRKKIEADSIKIF